MTIARYRMLYQAAAVFGAGLAILALAVTFWVTNPTSRFIMPVDWEYQAETREVIFARVVPTSIWGDWAIEIETEAGLQCSASGTTYYKSGDTSRFPVPVGLVLCLESGHPYVQFQEWRARRWGWLPLLPVYLETVRG